MKSLDIKAHIMFQRGVQYITSGNYEEALKSFDAASEAAPDSPEVWNNKAFVLFHLGRYEEVVRCCDKAIKLNPGYSDPWDIKARTLGKLGRYKESIDAIKKFIKVAPPEYAGRVAAAKKAMDTYGVMLLGKTTVVVGDQGVTIAKSDSSASGKEQGKQKKRWRFWK